MSLTQSETALLSQRQTELNAGEREIIEDALMYFERRLQEVKIKMTGDDGTARLEAAMVRYVIESKVSRNGAEPGATVENFEKAENP